MPHSPEEIQKALDVLHETEAEGGEGKGLARVLRLNKSIPRGWKYTSNAPYYREKYAVEVKKYIDEIIANKDTAKIITPRNGKIITTYHKLVQGQLYLVDHLDTPEGKYKAAKPHIKIIRSRLRKNITIVWRESLAIIDAEEDTVNAEHYLDDVPRTWKVDLENFIDNSSDGESFVRDRIVITEEDQNIIRRQLINLPQFHIKKLGKTVIEIIHQDLSKFEGKVA